MKILLASSELHPYSKTGGLADMVASLAKALAGAGHAVGIVTPLYRGINERFPAIKRFDWHMNLPLGPRWVAGEIWTLEPVKGITIYFVEQAEFFDRKGVYQENDVVYADNAERFIFFSKAVLHLARYLPWQPELIHVNDWQTALVPLLALHQKMQEGWSRIPKTCLTIHNLAYQGTFPAAQYALTNLPPDYFNLHGVEFYGGMNCLKAGIVYADVITTVSPRYAREITTVEYGCALDDLLRKRQSSLYGILNGVDYDEWNTTKNPHLPHQYSLKNMAGKTKDKLALQAELGLPVSATIPMFGSVTRLADQKGVDIQLAALEEMLSADIQFAMLGSGSSTFEKAYHSLTLRYPRKVAVRIGFNQGFSHRIEAASDFYLMPSRFEPCGLNQMYSLRYGTIPIVRVTGGLDDSVVDAAEDAANANGIKFTAYTARALARAMRKALVLYSEPKLLRHYQRNAIKMDFSWDRMVQQYVKVYQNA